MNQLNDTLSLGQHRVWKRMAVKWSGAKAGQEVLDVCCGSGDLAFRLAEAVGPTGKVGPPPCMAEQPWAPSWRAQLDGSKSCLF